MCFAHKLTARPVDRLEVDADPACRTSNCLQNEVIHEGTTGAATAERRVCVKGNVNAIAAFAERLAQVIGDAVESLPLNVAG